MKKKLFIVSLIIVLIFIIILALSLRQAKKTEPIPDQFENLPITREEAIQQTQDDKTSAEAINQVHQQYPWYSQIPIETADYRIIYDFDQEAFRIRLLNKSTDVIKEAALAELDKIGVDSEQAKYYFIEPETESQSGFQNLLR